MHGRQLRVQMKQLDHPSPRAQRFTRGEEDDEVRVISQNLAPHDAPRGPLQHGILHRGVRRQLTESLYNDSL